MHRAANMLKMFDMLKTYTDIHRICTIWKLPPLTQTHTLVQSSLWTNSDHMMFSLSNTEE